MDSTIPTWLGGDSEYSLTWAGRRWTLRLDGPKPGLSTPELGEGGLLRLDGLAAAGRQDAEAFGGGSPIGVETFRSRVQATYAPQDWGQLQVRASWSPTTEGDGIDLEVQVTACSVDELRSVEVLVSSLIEEGAEADARTSQMVWPRDRRAATLSYDGRENVQTLRRLFTTSLPLPGSTSVGPFAFPLAGAEESGAFLEMAHPDDAARRILLRTHSPDGTLRPAGARTGLFGHDLEKGVVLRGRLRVLWLPGPTVPDAGLVAAAFRRFLEEPPPLGM